MNEQKFNAWLDAQAAELPRSIEPERDLWPDIQARIDAGRGATDPQARESHSRIWTFAAGMAASAMVALLVVHALRGDVQEPDTFVVDAEPPATAAPVPSDPVETLLVEPTWISGVEQVSNDLRTDYEASLDMLSDETRQVVEENLAQIHDSLAKIHAALAKDPSNAALHRLLASTYQQELNLISSIGALNQSEAEL